MKKYILAAFVTLFATAAFVTLFATAAFAGEYAEVDVGSKANTVNNTQRTTYTVATYGQHIDQFDVEGRVGANRTTDTAVNSNFADARVRYNFADIAGAKPWVRGTVGEVFGNGTAYGSSYGYYAVEPGIGYQYTSALRADLSVQFTQPFNRSLEANDQTTYIAKVGYALSDKNTVGLKYSRAIQGNQPTAYEVQFARSF